MRLWRTLFLPLYLRAGGQKTAIGALLQGNAGEAADALHSLSDSSAAQDTIAGLARRRLITQKDLVTQITALFDASEDEAGWFLLEAGLVGAPDSALLVGTKMARLLAGEHGQEVIAYAEALTESASNALPLLHWAIVGLHRVGIDFGAAPMAAAWRKFISAWGDGNERVLAEARLARALGFPAHGSALLEAVGDGSYTHKALADSAASRDRWLDGDSGSAQYAALTEHFDTGADSPLHPTDLSGDPLENAFDYLLDRRGEGRAHYTPGNRLLMVGNSFAGGGMERVLARSYRHFSESNDFETVDLALIDYSDEGGAGFYRDEAGVSQVDIVLLERDGHHAMPFSLLPGSWKARSQRLYDHIIATQPRVIHAWNDLTGLLAAYAGIHAGCPRIVIHFHHGPAMPLAGQAEMIASYPAIYRRLAARPDVRLLFCSTQSARDYAQWWSLPQSEVFRVVHNGFDWPDSSPKPVGKLGSCPVIGAVMRFDSVKQPKLWIDAALALAAERPDVRFILVGDGPLRGEAEEMIKGAGQADRFDFVGQVSDVVEYYAAMDIFWLTSRSEGLPNVCIEAQFSGVPVVAFDVGGVRETFMPEETGILIAPDDSAALVRETAALLDDKTRLGAMGLEARRHARTQFSADRFFSALLSVYQD